MTNARGYEIEVPRVPLGELYGDALEAWLAGRGVRLHLSSGVKRLTGTCRADDRDS